MIKQKLTKKQYRGYAGIVDGKIDTGWIAGEDYSDNLYGIFKTKKEAEEHYEGVVKVIITICQ